MLTPEERNHLSKIAALVRAATPGLSFSAEQESGFDEALEEPWSHTYVQVKTASGRVITGVNKDFLADGELFAAARSEMAWLLRLVKRLDEQSE